MPVPLEDGLARVRELVLSDDLLRAVSSGRRRGEQPPWRRVVLRPVDLRAGRHLQATAYDGTQAHTRNAAEGAGAAALVDELLAAPFGNWHVETGARTFQLRVTKRGAAQLHEAPRVAAEPASDGRAHPHDRAKRRELDPADAWLVAVGLTSAEGRVKPSRRDKHRQVEQFCRQLATVVDDALASGRLRTPTAAEPLRVVDLGCGNAYLTFAAYRWLTEQRGLPVHFTGVDRKQQARSRNTELAERLGATGLGFVEAGIADVSVEPAAEVVLALHACDTATDEALARAVRWQASVLLAAPCCHHHLQAQLRGQSAPAPYGLLTRHNILRERLADTLTDAVRAALLRLHGYRVDVVEFVDSAHTPRNALLRGVRTTADGSAGDAAMRADYERLVVEWQVRPRLAELIGVVPS
ncbi:SAM-dependent methyltransferase [soil metagenome]